MASPAKKLLLEFVPRRGLWTNGAGEERIGEWLPGQGTHENSTDIDGGPLTGQVGHGDLISGKEIPSPPIEGLELLTDVRARLRSILPETLAPGHADPLRADIAEKMGHRPARTIRVEDLPGIAFQVVEPEARYQKLNPKFLVYRYAIEGKERVLDANGVGHFRSCHGTGRHGARRKERRDEEEYYDRLGNGALAIIEASRPAAPQTFDGLLKGV